MVICQFRFAAPIEVQFSSRDDRAPTLLAKLADAAVVGLSEDPPVGRATITSSVVLGDQPCNMSDQPHNRRMFQQQTVTDSRLQSQFVCQKDPTMHLDVRFDRSSVLMTVRWSVSWQSPLYLGSQLASPAISSPVPHPRAIRSLSLPQRQESRQKNPSLIALPSQHRWKGHEQLTLAIEHRDSSVVGPGGGFRTLATGVSSLSCMTGSAENDVCLFSSTVEFPAICSTRSTGCSRLSAITR